MKISKKLPLFITFAVLLSQLVTGGLNYVQAYHGMADMVEKDTESLLEEKKEVLQTYSTLR